MKFSTVITIALTTLFTLFTGAHARLGEVAPQDVFDGFISEDMKVNLLKTLDEAEDAMDDTMKDGNVRMAKPTDEYKEQTVVRFAKPDTDNYKDHVRIFRGRA